MAFGIWAGREQRQSSRRNIVAGKSGCGRKRADGQRRLELERTLS